MKEITAKPASDNLLPHKFLISALILVAVLLIGFLAYRGLQKPASPARSPQMTTLSQDALEENYGLRVQLLAVTAAGGLVDLRLQIADAEKAQAFLDDAANFPALRAGTDTVLRTAEDAAMQDIQFENGKSIFVLYPNTGNIIKSGDPVNIVLGDLQVEAITAQ